MPKFMPGTWGTLAALVIFVVCQPLLASLSAFLYLSIILLTAIIGIYLCGKTAEDLGVHDHSGIVWDEFVGFWLTMFLVPVTWYWLLAAFVLFRFFDIVKPWPIKWADRKVSGGFGIMLDDIIAAVFAWAVLQILLWIF
ncbi:UNVERIFIED_CONTAM: hypothetical protein GTU68_004951 [Idotea baltica]|nr:hypothetical protein [Idotea baltica]